MSTGLAAVAVAVAAAGQAITGVGFSLVSVPFLTIFVGPVFAVRTANLLALGLNVVMLAAERGESRWRDALRLFLPAAVAVPVVGIVVRRLDTDTLAVVTGSVTILAVVALASGLRVARLRGRAGAVVAGAVSGAMNVTAAVGGPAAAMYGVNAGWPHRQLRPTLQAYFLGLNIVSIAVLGLPPIRPALVAAAVVGWAVGARLAGRVSDDNARRATLAMAAGGGLAAVTRAIL
ncbi:MAG TPA: TSUP family transporter [Acidimicrobiales bacterium]|nr:TSUP family transporter [Acidimicrobiales bacterium]